MDQENMSHLTPLNKDAALENFVDILKIGLNFKLREKVLQHKEFEKLFGLVYEELPADGIPLKQLNEFVQDVILPYSTNYSSPFAMAFPDSGNSIAGISGAILENFLNQNLINWSPCSPMGTVIEMLVITWLRKLVGYATKDDPKVPLDVGGFTTSGGVASNTIALLLAREKIYPGTMKHGVHSIREKFVAIVPDGIEHYSSRLSLGWLGLGTNNVLKGKTKNFKYDLPALQTQLRDLASKDIRVISITAYAGDSRSMTCDNLVALRKICDRFDIWLHVDGCHGTQLLFSSKLRSIVAGIELADSITFDPHKVLTIPYPISILLVKNVLHLEAIRQPEDIIMGEAHSFGQITPFYGSRAFQSLKLYMLIKHLGVSGLSNVIENRCSIAKRLAEFISKEPDFILINPCIHINSVMFMFLPAPLPLTSEQIGLLNRLSTKIQKTLLEIGNVWLHNFEIPDLSNVFGLGEQIRLRPLRFMSGNPSMTEKHLNQMLHSVREVAVKILREDALYFDDLKALHVFSPSVASIPQVQTTVKSTIDTSPHRVNLIGQSLDKRITMWIHECISTDRDILFDFDKNKIATRAKPLGCHLQDHTDKLTSNYIALQIVLFLKTCASINTMQFGKFTKPGLGKNVKWHSVILKIIDDMTQEANKLTHFQKHVLQKYIKIVTIHFEKSAVVDLLNNKSSVLVPMDLSVGQFFVDNEQAVRYKGVESFFAGDALFAYASFISQILKTDLGTSFMTHWGKLHSADIALVHAYAMLYNILDLIHIMSENPRGDINYMFYRLSPCSLIEALDQSAATISENECNINHVSIRNNVGCQSTNYLERDNANHRISDVIDMMRSFCSIEFRSNQEAFYAIIYGSYSYGMAQNSSDIDILFVTENVEAGRRKRVADFVISLHDKYGMRKDNEIPYERKVVLSMKFVQRASEGEGTFLKDEWKFPQISKDPQYLASEELLLRFVQGMLVNPHIFVDGNHKLYNAHRSCATLNTIKGILYTNAQQKTNAKSLMEAFCRNEKGQTGDFFLGFSHKEPFISYLSSHLESILSKTKDPCGYNKHGAEYEFCNRELLERSTILEFM